MKEGKKIEIVKLSNNKKLIANCMNINHKNIYHKSKMEIRDLEVKKRIEENHITNSAYGHRRLAIDLKLNYQDKYTN